MPPPPSCRPPAKHPPVAIDFDIDIAPSIYPLILTILSPISIAGVTRTELEVLEEGLRVRGFGLKDIASDGNCFYRSVAYHALGDEEWHPHIRACAIDELRVGGWVGRWVGGLVGGSVGRGEYRGLLNCFRFRCRTARFKLYIGLE